MVQRSAARETTDTAETEGPPRRGRRMLALEGLAVYAFYQALTFVYLAAVRTSDHTFFQDVLLNGVGPDREATSHMLRDGFLPTWTRDLYGGQPFTANIQHAVYYPFNAPWLFLPTSTALKVVVATTIAFGAFGMWAYCRFALRTGMWGATIAGLGFGFGGVSLQHIILTNQLQAISWMPLVLLFAHLALERARLRWVVATAVAIGLQFLAGHPEEWVYTVMALALYGLVWSFGNGLRGWWRRALGGGIRLGGAIVLFVLLFGWQLFPTLLLRSQGYRQAPSFHDQYPLPKALAVNSLLPDFGRNLFGENVGFVGAVLLALAALGIVARRRDLRWVQAWLGILALFGFLMAVGNATPFYRLAYDNLSIVRGFRVPSRYLMLPSFAICAAGAIGLDSLLNDHVGRLRGRLTDAAKAAGVGAAGLVFALVVGDVTNPGRKTLLWWAAAAVVFALGWLAATVRAVPRIAVALLLVAFTATELNYARPIAEYRQVAPNLTYDDYGPFTRTMAAEGGRFVTIGRLPLEGGKGAPIPVPSGFSQLDRNYFTSGFQYRVVSRPNVHIALQAESVLGRDGGLLPFRLYREFFQTAAGAQGSVVRGVWTSGPSGWNWEMLDFLGVRWFVANPLPAEEEAVLKTHGFHRRDSYAFGELWERPEPPLMRVVGDVDVLPDPQARIDRLRAYPLRTRAIVEHPVDGVTPGATGTVTGIRVGRTTVTGTATASAPALVVLGDPWYPQWQAYVDGKKAELVRVDHAFRAVRVPAGTHRVEFRYEDASHVRGVVLALLTILGLAVASVLRVRRRRRPPRGTAPPETAATD